MDVRFSPLLPELLRAAASAEAGLWHAEGRPVRHEHRQRHRKRRPGNVVRDVDVVVIVEVGVIVVVVYEVHVYVANNVKSIVNAAQVTS